MSRIANMEIAFIKFNERVLDMARDKSLSLNKRLSYIKICTSNMDEFISVRLGGIKNIKINKPKSLSIDGLTPKVESRIVYDYLKMHYAEIECAYNDILEDKNYSKAILNINSLCPVEIEIARAIFNKTVYSSLSLYRLNKQTDVPYVESGATAIFASVKGGTIIIPVPTHLDRYINLGLDNTKLKNNYIRVEDLIIMFAHEAFNLEIIDCLSYRVLKNFADNNIYSLDSQVKDVEGKLNNRRHGEAILFEITPCIDSLKKSFIKALGTSKKKVVQLNHINKLSCTELSMSHIDTKHVPKYDKYRSILKTLELEDILLQHPYDSIQYVIDFLEESACDPDVVTIRQTVYRLSKESPLMKALLKAIENGKDVTVVFEVTAQFDEANNMHWAKRILKAGGNVVYGVQDKKVHCKVMLVTKKIDNKLVNFAHIGTCNYNELNSAFFSDISYFTSNETTGTDIVKLFNSITSTVKQNFESILSGPFIAKKALMSKIDKEIEVSLAGGRGYICGKMNALQDIDMINKFYEASEAGVQVDLVVRGLCCLKTNEEYSKNITVKSIVGEFLEHSRLYYFHNDKHKLYMGTADLMQRNLEGRFEILTPFLNKDTHRKMLLMLNKYLGDCNSYFLEGTNYKKYTGSYNVHEYFKL